MLTIQPECIQIRLICCQIPFFNQDSLHARLNSHYKTWSQKKKKDKKIKTHEICLERIYSRKMSINSRLIATKIIGQGKAFYRQRISQSSGVRKETVDIDILVTSRNGDRKIMQSIRITSRPSLRKRKQSNLSWPHVKGEPRVQEKQQVKDQQSCIFVFVSCLTIPNNF